MLITTPWLLQYLDPHVPHDALMGAFPKIGLEIEESSPLEPGPGFLVDLNVLANRPDYLGILGIAREVAAHFKLAVKYPVIETSIDPAPGRSPVSIEIREPDLCPRYIGQVMSGVKIGPSPEWLRDLLISIGQRPINNVVDITNFVMLEWGQPLHAFDFAKIAGKKIIVRRMAPGEKLELLGGKTISADEQTPMLAICDAQRAVALAGIMGGKASETRESSNEILLEAANFDPPTVRRAAKRIDVSTESSYRFERGCDPNRMLEGAMNRARALLTQLAAAKAMGPAVDVYPVRREPRLFNLTAARVASSLGTAVNNQTIHDSLTRLEMLVTDDLTITVPTWRIDAVDSVVLIEDVARLIGYDALPMTPTAQSPTLGQRSALDELRQQIAAYLSAAGFFEARSPSLDSPEALAAVGADPQTVVRLKNPMSREASMMRTSLLPALVRVADRNVRRGATTTRFFELDRVYHRRTSDPKEPGAYETWMLGGIAGGAVNEFDWSGRAAEISFYDVKGVLEDLLEVANVRDAIWRPIERPGFHSHACADIVSLSDRDNPVGHLGLLDGGVIDLGKISFPLFAFELNLHELLKTHAEVAAYKPLARTPAVWRDLAIVVRAETNFVDIGRAIRDAAGAMLESLRLVDVYQGKQVTVDHKSMAFRLIFRDPTRTLTAEEVQKQMDQIIALLTERFNATLRT